MAQKFTDQQVVAAFNSCLDLEKYKTLPSDVRERFAALLKKNRVKAVCFMEEVGLGLRVFIDNMDVTRSGDEVQVREGETQAVDQSPAGVGRVDAEGCWLRCPADLFKVVEEFVVANERGTEFYSEKMIPLPKTPIKDDAGDEDEDEEEDEEDETQEELLVRLAKVPHPDKVPERPAYFWLWTTLRSRAYRFQGRETAEAVAATRVKGIVLKP